MKVYVDEFPDNCKECKFKSIITCGILGESVFEYMTYETSPKNCPLQSLTEHDKQVRKEVCEEIQAKIEERARYSTNNNDGWDILIDENSFLEILDQIQGETK